MKFIILTLLLIACFVACKQIKSSQIVESSIYSKELNRDVKIWTYLPPNYNPKISYPLLVMHDGQNLFYDSLAYAGQWHLAEKLDSLYLTSNKSVIAVGIENGGEARINELTPYPNQKYGGGHGQQYLDFIENTLLPKIEQEYSVSAQKSQRTMMGSSLGGLITYYHAFSQNTTFGNYGVYSPSIWYTNHPYQFAETKKLPATTKMLLMIGEQEQDEHLNVIKLNKILEDHQNIKLKTDIYPEGKHQEWFWSKYLYQDLTWLIQ